MKFFTRRQISYCQWGILLAAAVWNFLKVFQFALDVPVEDDWDYLTAAGNWKDIFAVHVQHRIVFTRILFNLSYMVNSLNFRWLIIINWFVYVLLALSVMLLFKKEIKRYPGFGLFFLPFFSDTAQANLIWAGQNQFHFMLLFGMLAIYFGFPRRKSSTTEVWYRIFLILSTFSMSPLLSAVISGCRIMKEVSLLMIFRKSDPIKHIKNIGFEIFWDLMIFGAFFINYIPAELPHPPLDKFLFFSIVNIVKSLTLFKSDSPLFLLVALRVMLILPCVIFFKIMWKQKLCLLIKSSRAAVLIIWAVIFSVAIAWGRNGIMDWRHTEAVLPLIPAFGAVIIKYSTGFQKKLTVIALILLLSFSLCFAFNFNYANGKIIERRAGLQKLHYYLEHPETEPDIPELYPWRGLRKKIDFAAKLDISCLKK